MNSRKSSVWWTILIVFGAASVIVWGSVGALLGGVVTPGFSKAFSPDTIGSGNVSTLVFSITGVGSPVTDLAFTDTLPAGVTITTPAHVASSCGGTVTAPAGGGTIALTGGTLAASSNCTIAVDVTSSSVGAHLNVSGPLSSSLGSSPSAQATLTVSDTLLGFTKSFKPSNVLLGENSAVTLTIDNPNDSLVFNMSFSDALPTGLTVASPANAFTTCLAGTLTASPGSSEVSFVGGALTAASSCVVSFDVRAGSAGTLINTTSDLASNLGSSGRASAAIQVSTTRLFLRKEFTDDPVPPGSTVNLRFTVTNFNRTDPATNIAFSDDLDAALAGLAAVGLPLANPCGPGSTLSGVGQISLTGGSLDAAGSCSFNVTLQVPPTTTSGVYNNLTSAVTANVGGGVVTGNQASDNLLVQAAPLLTKSFVDDPVVAGGVVTLEFTLLNTSPVFDASGITFSDNLTQTLPGLTPNMLPANGFCGAGSTMTSFAPAPGEIGLLVNGASLGFGESCTFQATLQVPAGVPPGSYLNTTSAPSATVNGSTFVGRPASDRLQVPGTPILTKSFTDDPVLPGGVVTLEFTLSRGPDAIGDATNIAFSDDLSFLAGLTATDLPKNDVCGTGSALTGTTNLSFTGGTLSPGESCTFSASLSVPAGAPGGNHDNTTSSVTATAAGLAVTGNPANDTLQVAGLTVAKEFTDDPVVPGGMVTLEFTIQNNSPVLSATNISFSDDLGLTLSGLTATGLPTDPCGMGSSLTGSSLLTFSGGNLAPGASCTFSATLQVPAGAAAGEYANTTSNVSADIDGSPAVIAPAGDSLLVESALMIAKSFTDDPASPGGTVTLEFTISNLSATDSATGVTFTDNLDAVLSGLVAEGLPANDVCGAGSSLTGTSLLTLTNGNLAAGASCTFSATLRVPAGASPSANPVNSTSVVSGVVGGVSSTGNSASDTLRLVFLTFTKAFDGLSVAGGSPRLSFTIGNLGGAAAPLSFADDLNATLSGLQAAGLPANDVCGSGSVLTGTGSIVLNDGALGAGASCTFDVQLQVPAAAAPGAYPNSTTDLRLGGVSVSAPATASLVIEPPPTFSKTFSPDAIGQGQVSALTFVIDNTASALAASNLSFTDNLPAGVTVEASPNASTTCTGGTLTAVAGSSVISYSGGAVSAGSSCTVSVDVTSTIPGIFVNTTGTLTSSSGSSGTAGDTLTVHAVPVFSKAFSPGAIQLGGVSALTFTIDLSAGTAGVTGLSFTDNLPAGVQVATPANGSTTCTGGTLTAVGGSGTISYSGGSLAAGATCTVAVDVTSSTEGAHLNTSGNLTSSLGDSGSASDTLNVVTNSIFLEKDFVLHPVAMMAIQASRPSKTGGVQEGSAAISAAATGVTVLRGGLVDLEYTITNTSATFPLTNIFLSDDLDAALPGLVAVGLPLNDVCGAGSTISGTSVVGLSNGSLAVSSSCTFVVTVQIPADAPVGLVTSTSGSATGTAGGAVVTSDPASSSVEVIFLDFSKEFISYNPVSGEAVLAFTIANPDLSNAASNIAFTDDLEAVVPGLTAIGLPLSEICGAGSLLTGTSLLSFSGGTLGPNETCTFNVTLQVPPDTTPGTFTNVTSPIEASVGGSTVTGEPADAAQATITVNPLAIPLLSDWGFVLLFLLLGLAALWKLRRAPGQ